MDAIDYHSELERWQACSHPKLANTQPEELFEAPFPETYRRLHNDLWQRIIRVHGTLRTLEQLNQFPFDYVYTRDRMEFWRLVILNFLDIAMLKLHGLVVDSGIDVHSLRSFQAGIMRATWLSQENRDLLQQTLRERRFDQGIDLIASRVDAIRDNVIAHRLMDRLTGNPKEALAAVSLEELRRLFDAAHSLFGALSFGSSYVTLAGDLTPTTIGGEPTRTCLDKVLDGVLRDSGFVNQPERRAEWWPEQRKHTSPERIDVMNELRNRIGLPEA